MSPNNLNIIAAAAAAALSSSSQLHGIGTMTTAPPQLDDATSKSKKLSPKALVLPSELAPSNDRLQWNGTDYAMDKISREDIHDHDVLSGRGGASNNHPGNENFRKLVNNVKFEYLQCPKREKPLLAMRIVQAVRAQSPPGRFLQHDKHSDTWRDVGDSKAREKTSQALREGAPIIRDMVHKPSPSSLATVLKEVKKEERKNEAIKKIDGPVNNNDAYLPNQHSPMSYWTPTSAGLPRPPQKLEPAINQAASYLNQPKPQKQNMVTHHSALTSNVEANMWNFYHQQSVESQRVSGEYAATERNEPPPVPFSIVRGILLGHIDPVIAAANILCPEEAAMVSHCCELRQNAMSVADRRSQTSSAESLLDLTRISSSSSSGSDQSELSKSRKTVTSQRRTPFKKRKIIVDS